MSGKSSPKRRKDVQETCESIHISLLDDGSIAVTFVPKKGKRKKQESMVLKDRQVRGLRHVLDKYTDEVPNKELIASIKAAEKYMKSGKVKWYDNVDDFMSALLK